MTAMLDNKATFSDYARSLGVLVPDHYVVTSPQQLMQLNAGKVAICCEHYSLLPVYAAIAAVW